MTIKRIDERGAKRATPPLGDTLVVTLVTDDV
jgi:hypothetical protein